MTPQQHLNESPSRPVPLGGLSHWYRQGLCLAPHALFPLSGSDCTLLSLTLLHYEVQVGTVPLFAYRIMGTEVNLSYT